jgi:hypothetical protein
MTILWRGDCFLEHNLFQRPGLCVSCINYRLDLLGNLVEVEPSTARDVRFTSYRIETPPPSCLFLSPFDLWKAFIQFLFRGRLTGWPKISSRKPKKPLSSQTL